MAIGDYWIALCLTLVIETGTTAIMGYWTLPALRTVVLVNLVTHPLLWYVVWAGESYGLPFSTTPVILCLEVVIVVIEWLLLLFVLQQRTWKLLWLSLSMNAASYLGGAALCAL
jgi:hypothetical protein